MFFEDGILEKLDAFAESILRYAERYASGGTTGCLPRGKLPALPAADYAPLGIRTTLSFVRFSQGPNQLTIKLRNRLYEHAASGARNPHWANFPAIRTTWRRATLRYWLTHWFRPER